MMSEERFKKLFAAAVKNNPKRCKAGHTFTLQTVFGGATLVAGKFACKKCDAIRKASAERAA
jgi:hypothetical protein